MDMWGNPVSVMLWIATLTGASLIPIGCRVVGSAFGYAFAVQLWRTYLFKYHRIPAALIFIFTIAFELACVAASIIAVSKALAGIGITDSTVLMVSHLLNLASHIYLPIFGGRYVKAPSVHSNGRTYKRKSTNTAT
jgi:hypothetical protein